MKKRKGNVGNLMITGITVLAMMVLLLAYMDKVELINQKAEVSQLARRYILKMETVGYLKPQDSAMLREELETLGVTEINFAGSTMGEVDYGDWITLQICGKLRGEYAFEETRVSTAKN